MSAFGALDWSIGTFLLGLRTPLGDSAFSAATRLGDETIVIVITVIACVLLYRSPGLRAYAAGLAVAVVGSGATTYLLKYMVDRSRPTDFLPVVFEASPSFPSMHAALAIALYGFAAYLLCLRYPARRSFIAATAILLILAVGISRLYLGVHFASDVLSGWLVGGLWLALGIHIVRSRTRAENV